jgi:hypothetical protein
MNYTSDLLVTACSNLEAGDDGTADCDDERGDLVLAMSVVRMCSYNTVDIGFSIDIAAMKMKFAEKALYKCLRDMVDCEEKVTARNNPFVDLNLHRAIHALLTAEIAFEYIHEESESMIISQLPYREDVRDVPHKDIGPADRDSVDAAKRMIEKCTLSCDANDFADSLPENPYLKHFFGYLESVSLGKNLGDVEDGTRMNVTEMREQAGKEIKDFANCLPEDEVPIKADRKRKTAPSSLKVVPEKETIPQEWIEMFKNDEIVDLKNDELKAFLKSQGERLTGKKADLVDRVQRCIEKELFND